MGEGLQALSLGGGRTIWPKALSLGDRGTIWPKALSQGIGEPYGLRLCLGAQGNHMASGSVFGRWGTDMA